MGLLKLEGSVVGNSEIRSFGIAELRDSEFQCSKFRNSGVRCLGTVKFGSSVSEILKFGGSTVGNSDIRSFGVRGTTEFGIAAFELLKVGVSACGNHEIRRFGFGHA